ncbi:MAG: hypothetical protein WC718_09565 [Phycisphaerales bacterium]|jgi:hypothetical protein
MKRHAPRLLLLAIAACSLASITGCYEHVVRTSGFGKEGVNTYEGRPNTEADQWFDENILGKDTNQTRPLQLTNPPPQ